MSRTQIDFRGSSIQASSLSAGRVVSETPVEASAASSYAYVFAATGANTSPYSFTQPGSYVISGVSRTAGAAFSTIAHVSKDAAGAYTLTATTAPSTGSLSGTIIPSISASPALALSRGTNGGNDTFDVSVRKL
jgi:hypothetical protein